MSTTSLNSRTQQTSNFQDGRYAVIDIGTVSCRLLVADVREGELAIVARECTVVNLGEGVDKNGYLLPAAIERTLAAIDSYREIISQLSLGSTPLIPCVFATSASRDASNAHVLQDALAERGLSLQVITGDMEAELSFTGAGIGLSGQNIILVDIGGGSTEIVAGKVGEAPLFARSFNLGCRRLTERFFAGDSYPEHIWEEARELLYQNFDPYFEEIYRSGFALDTLVAVAGTATSAISIDKKMEVYCSDLVHHSVLTLERLRNITESLREQSLQERRQVVGLMSQRADVIVAGLLILQCVMEAAGVEEYLVSESDNLQAAVLWQAEGRL